MRFRGIVALVMGSALSAVVFLTFPNAYHPAEGPVADLVAASDLVILADVTGVAEDRAAPPPAAPGSGVPLVARLAVRQVWKGEASGTIEVPFEGCLGWPAPPGYANGSRVIAFLRRAGGGWTTLRTAGVPATSDSPDLFDPATAASAPAGTDPGRHASCLPGLSAMTPAGSVVR